MAGVFKIGPHLFLSIDGVPPVRQQQGQLVVRPGVNGVAFVLTGTRGVPFTVRTRVDCESKAAALAKRVEYAELAFAGKQSMIWGDHSVVTEDGAKVMVLEVRTLACGELLVSSGGLNPPSLGYLECEWDLILC